MPNIVEGAGASGSSLLVGKDLGYRYPEGLDLKPGSTLHTKIVTEVNKRARASYNVMKGRHKNWRELDKNLTAFVEMDSAERAIKDDDDRKPVRIVVPYSYATLETLLAYFTAAFLTEGPLFRYEGRSPEDVMGALLLEKNIDYQSTRAKVALALHTMFRDGFVYGFGVGAPQWTIEKGFKTFVQEGGWWSHSLNKWFGRENRVTKPATLYEGNVLKSVDPYRYLPDPDRPLYEVQGSDFCGWAERTSLVRQLEVEQSNLGVVFNSRYLEGQNSLKSSILDDDPSGRKARVGATTTPNSFGTTRPLDKIYMYVNLVPKSWELGTGEYPEKWMFCVAGDMVIVEARKLGLNHNMFPVAINAPDFDGHGVSPISRLEIIQPLQVALDWLFTSHIANVRKAMNDMLIVDPSLINMNDLKKPGAGRLIRLRKQAWGRGVEAAVKQLKVEDVTRQHIGDSSYIIDLIQRVTAATDSMQGLQRKGGERVTAQEFSSVKMGAVGRLAMAAKITSAQAMQDIAYMFASHTQQFMTEDMYVKVAGDWIRTLQEEYGIEPEGVDKNRMKVSPNDLVVDYDVISGDGTVDSGDNVQDWNMLFSIIAKNEQLSQKFDMVRIFKHVARKMGAKNVDQFEVKTMPNEQVANQAQAGNLVPADELPTMGGGGMVG